MHDLFLVKPLFHNAGHVSSILSQAFSNLIKFILNKYINLEENYNNYYLGEEQK
jgi:hypothetical protein